MIRFSFEKFQVIFYKHMHSYKPEITVAIVSCRPMLASRCIESLLQQTLDCNRFQILIVADYASPSFTSKQVRWILNVPKSIAANRNIALRESGTEFIAFIDDDCIASPDWLKNGLRYLETHPDEIGVQGKIMVPEKERENTNFKETARLMRPLYQTANIFYRTKPVLEMGGFDERFIFQREDIDLGFSLIQKGYKIGFEPESAVEHPIRKNEYWDLIHTAFRKRYDPLLQKKHPTLFRQYVGHILPGSFLLMLVLWTLTIAGFAVLPQIAILPVLLGSLSMTFRKLRGTHWSVKWISATFINYLIAPPVALFVILAGKIRY
jgi:cellulose synthase/poly-beta-1,6-N-acetylglucosamine synthase-like glycosyltransferase